MSPVRRVTHAEVRREGHQEVRKTLNEPSGAYWLERFIVHAERHGYLEEAERARAKLQTLQAKGRAA